MKNIFTLFVVALHINLAAQSEKPVFFESISQKETITSSCGYSNSWRFHPVNEMAPNALLKDELANNELDSIIYYRNLDTTYYKEGYDYGFEYDSKDRIVSFKRFDTERYLTSHVDFRFELDYQKNRQMKRHEMFALDTLNNNWKSVSIETNQYTSAGVISNQETRYIYDSSSESYAKRVEYLYNDMGQLSEAIYYSSYEGGLFAWTKELYHYESDSKTTITTYNKDYESLEWYPFKQLETSVLDNEKQIITKNWIIEDSLWQNSELRIEKTTNSGFETLRKDWDSKTQTWVNAENELLTYHPGKTLPMEKKTFLWSHRMFRWDISEEELKKDSAKWELANRTLFEYDVQDKPISIITYSGANSERILQAESTSYNEQGNILKREMYTTFWFGLVLGNELENIYDENGSLLRSEIYSNNYEYNQKLSYVYKSKAVTAVKGSNNLVPVEVKTYPNPANERINFAFNSFNPAELKIYDLGGKLQIEQNIFSDEKIEISHLKPGTYVYRLKIEGRVETGKFIKK